MRGYRSVVAVASLWLVAAIESDALMPPHADFVEWEPVQVLRRRLNLTYTYQPRHLSPEHCRHLTEEACQQEDETLGHAKAGTHGRHLSPSVGTDIRLLVVLVRFSDHTTRNVPSREYFDTLFNGDGPSDVNPVGSIKEYLWYASMGKYQVTFDVRDWHTLPNTEAYYSEEKYGMVGNVNVQEMFTSAMDAVDAAGVDWVNGYVSDWGMINHVSFITSGYGAEFGPIACAPNEPPTNRIWSQGTSSLSNGWVNKDFFELNAISIASAFATPSCENDVATAAPAGMGIIVHEYLHGFQLIDLYDQDNEQEAIAIGGTAKWCLMSNAFGWDRGLKIPGHLSAYSRSKVAGWLEPIVIAQDGMYAIQASEISSQVYKISHNFPEGEYLLIENRQPVKWDQNWPHSGIVIYHVDERAPQQTKRGYPGKEGWPANHYLVSVIQADGLYDIETGVNLGDEGDFWTKDQVLGPGPNFPNTDSIQGGIQTATGISITIRSNSGFIMAFQVSGLAGSNVRSLNNETKRDSKGLRRSDPDSTGHAMAWVLSMLGGAAALIGVLVVLL